MRLCISVLSLLAVPAVGMAQRGPPPPQGGGLPAVSPKGDVIAYISNLEGSYDVYITSVDGSHKTRISNSPAPESAPAWTDDGRVVFATWDNQNKKSTVYAASERNPTPSVIGSAAAQGPRISPNGKKLLYAKGDFPALKISESELDGSAERELSKQPSAQFNVSYSPNQKLIAFVRMDSTRQLQVFVMNADGTGERQLTKFSADEGSPQWPAWSPDGSRLAIQSGKYDRNNPAANSAHIWLIELKSGATTKLNPHGAYLDETPSWFPDGNRIAFQSNRTGRMEIWVMNADGTGAVQVTK